MIYRSFTQQRFDAANAVAMQHGLPTIRCDGGEECEFTADDDNDCPGCNRPLRFGAKLWWVRTSYEYEDGDYHCSPACASGHGNAGSPTDFLERIGWTLWWIDHDNPDAKPRWTLVETVGERERPIAQEGSAQWEYDNRRARALAAEVDDMMMAAHRLA